MNGLDLVKRVTTVALYTFDERPRRDKRRVAVYDYGVNATSSASSRRPAAT